MFGVRYTYSRNTIEVNTAGSPLVPPRKVEADDLIDPFLGGRITLNLFDNQMDLITGKGPSARHELSTSAGPRWAPSGSTT